MTDPIYDESILSDLYKDANGCRPGEFFWARWNTLTVEEKNREWLYLCDAVDLAIEEDRRQEQLAEAAYETKLADLLASGARDREQAKRWLVDSLDIGEQRDPGYACYLLGLPYRMENEFSFLQGVG